jgi:dynein heavy chain
MAPKLVVAAKENDELLIILEEKNKVANEMMVKVGKEASVANEKRNQVDAIKNECETELSTAMPALIKA